MLTWKPIRVAVLCSHRAPGLVDLIDRCADPQAYEIVTVITSELAFEGQARVTARGVPTRAHAIREFYRRREMGSGTFLTRDVFENATSQRTSEILKQRIAGLRLVLSPCSSAVYAAATRGSGSIENRAFLRDCGNPARVIDRGCPASVYLDGVPVYRALQGEPPFNINQITPGEISAVEFYAGTAQLPSEYRYSASTCAVLVFWTR